MGFVSMENPASLIRGILWGGVVGIAVYYGIKLMTWVLELYRIRKSVQRHWPSRPYHWFWGHFELIKLVRDSPEKFFDMISSISQDFSHGTGLYIGPLLTFLRVTNHKIIQKILGGSEVTFPKSYGQYSYLEPWLGRKGLLLLGGREWQRHRHLLTNSFHFDVLRSYNAKMNECSKVLVGKWKAKVPNVGQGVTIELFEDFGLMTLDALMKCLMGFDCNSQIDDGVHLAYVKGIKRNTNLLAKRMRNSNPLMRFDFLYYYLTREGREYLKSCREVRAYAEKVVDLRRNEYSKGVKIGSKLGLNRKQEHHYDFLDILLQAKDSEGNTLTREEVSDEVNTFIFEGHDTTTSAISWTCHCLASNSACQKKCVEEIHKVLGAEDCVEYEDLGKLKYLTLCIKEALRMYPPVPSIARRPTEDFTVDGKPIKSGSQVVVSLLGTHYDSKHWSNPMTFDPLRFSPENSVGRDPYAYVPFSAGIRNCIGQNFAMNEIKVCMVHALREFEFSIDKEKPALPIVELIFRAKGGLHVRVKRKQVHERINLQPQK